MAVTATPVFIQTPKCGLTNFVQGTDSAGTYKTLISGGTNGTKVTSINVATDDGTATHVLTLAIQRSATNYVIGAYTIPLSSGTSGAIASVDLLRGGPANLIPGLAIDNDGNPYIYLQSGDNLVMTFATALTSSKRIDVVTTAGDF